MRFQRLLTGLKEPRIPYVAVVDDVLSAGQCEALIARIEALSPAAAPITTARGFVMDTEVRNNERVMFDDIALATELFERLRDHLPATFIDRHGDTLGQAVGLNERFRGYRYSTGHRFAPHFDGAFVRSQNERSELTLLLYLNEGFLGGATAFCDFGERVVPRRGQALFFEHVILHEGCAVDGGRKYVLRSDVMYRTGQPD